MRDRNTGVAVEGDGIVPTADSHRHVGIRSGRPARDEDVEEHETQNSQPPGGHARLLDIVARRIVSARIPHHICTNRASRGSGHGASQSASEAESR